MYVLGGTRPVTPPGARNAPLGVRAVSGRPGSWLAVVNRNQCFLSVPRARDYCQIMLKRGIAHPPEHLFPPDEWRVIEARYSDEFAARTETVFSLGNGFIGIRGSFGEGRPGPGPGNVHQRVP